VTGFAVDQARAALEERLERVLRQALDITATEAERAAQLLAAEFDSVLVAPDDGPTFVYFALVDAPPPVNEGAGAACSPAPAGERPDDEPPASSGPPPNRGALAMRIIRAANDAHHGVAAAAHQWLAREIRIVTGHALSPAPAGATRALLQLAVAQLERILDRAETVLHAQRLGREASS